MRPKGPLSRCLGRGEAGRGGKAAPVATVFAAAGARVTLALGSRRAFQYINELIGSI